MNADCPDLSLNVCPPAAENASEANRTGHSSAAARIVARVKPAHRKAHPGERMLAQENTSPPEGAAFSLMAAADLQDDLMVASNDLERLQRLLSDACESLMEHFYGANGELRTLLQQADARVEHPAPQVHKAMQHMAGAITAMQFQDMASQLVDHTSRRLRNCADRLASQTMGDDEDGTTVIEAKPLRPNPVTQDEMDAGSVELF
jgi:hypothetical protein